MRTAGTGRQDGSWNEYRKNCCSVRFAFHIFLSSHSRVFKDARKSLYLLGVSFG